MLEGRFTARGAKRDSAFVAAARWLGIQELDRRAALAAKRRAERAARVAVIEAEVMMQRIARNLGLKPG